MKLDQLTYFLAVARYQHVGKAAKSLHISPSAISHCLRSLEEELQCALVEQRGRNIFVTEAVKLLQRRAEELLIQAEKIREEIGQGAGELRGHLRIAASHVLASSFVMPAWMALQKEHAAVTTEILTLRSAAVIESVIAGEVDLGVCFSPQDHATLATQKLYEGTLVLAARKNHPIFEQKGSAMLKALSKFPAVLPKAFRGIEVCEKHPMFERFGIHPVSTCLFDNYQIAIDLVKQSDTWSFLPDLLIEEHAKHIRVLPLPSGWNAPFHISAVWLRDRSLNAAFRALVQKLDRH